MGTSYTNESNLTAVLMGGWTKVLLRVTKALSKVRVVTVTQQQTDHNADKDENRSWKISNERYHGWIIFKKLQKGISQQRS